MRTYEVPDQDGRLVGFEVDNVLIGPAQSAALLRGVAGVSAVEQRKLFSRFSDVHVRFEYHGVPYVVCEPFGDNSRYWIGPTNPQGAPQAQIAALRAEFERYAPALWRRALLTLLTLKFRR